MCNINSSSFLKHSHIFVHLLVCLFVCSEYNAASSAFPPIDILPPLLPPPQTWHCNQGKKWAGLSFKCTAVIVISIHYIVFDTNLNYLSFLSFFLRFSLKTSINILWCSAKRVFPPLHPLLCPPLLSLSSSSGKKWEKGSAKAADGDHADDAL